MPTDATPVMVTAGCPIARPLEGHTDERAYFSEVPVEEWTAAKIRAEVDALRPEDRADHEATKSAMLADVKRIDQEGTTTGHNGEQQ